MIGPGPGIETPQEIIQEICMEMAKIEVGTEDKGPELFQETEGIDQGLDQAPMLAQIGIGHRCYRCNEYDHFARECPNIMSDEEQDAVLQLLAQEEQAEALSHSDLSDLNL